MKTPEVWKDVPGFEGLYRVSNHGRLRSLSRRVAFGTQSRVSRGRILKQHLVKGYPSIHLFNKSKNGFYVHQLVASAFLGGRPSSNHQVAHNNGDPLDNRASNLRWATAQGNQKDRIVHGTSNRGERHGNSKLTRDAVLAIRKSDLTQRQLARDFGVSFQTISSVVSGKTWGWLI